MGQTGVGKSKVNISFYINFFFDVLFFVLDDTNGILKFINTAVGRLAVEVGHDLESMTAEPRSILCDALAESVYLVDTPGFDDTYNENDIATLNKIIDWFNNSGSVLYF
jgi:hypothetical protein